MRAVGIDVGGTFTDLVEVDDEKGEYRYHKLASTPEDPSRAFLQGVSELAAGRAAPERYVHGSTLATNALIQRSGARTALITTRGHRDVLEIARGVKPYAHIFDLMWEKPKPLVPRYLRIDVRERLDSRGAVIEPLDDGEVALACDFFTEHGVEAVAICFLFSYLNDTHERRAAEIVATRMPGIPVSTSSSILPQWREYERTSTTVADAHLKPVMVGYLNRLESGLREQGFEHELLIMKSNGGVMSAHAASAFPIETYLSGPAAGVVAGRAIGKAIGLSDLIVIDMGGTSFDTSIVSHGEVGMTTEAELGAGIPIKISMLDVRAIGAGGGSIAWIDRGGGLRVGPRSAGAHPGPACYLRGGVEPTVTDANLMLGRLSADAFLGGRFVLDPQAAEKAIHDKVARPLGLTSAKAAQGIIDVCISNAVREIRAVTAERGIDPRGYALLAGGGAGPLHAAHIARELGIATIVVPTFPGVLSAIGLVLSDLRFDSVRSLPLRLEREGSERVAAYFDEMVKAGLDRLRNEGFKGESFVSLSLDMRYVGQNWEIEVPVRRESLDVKSLARLFDTEHDRLYHFQMPEHEHEVINLRASVSGLLERSVLHLPRRTPQGRNGGVRGAPRQREIYDEGLRRFVEALVLDRDDLRDNEVVRGPAIVEELDTTIYISSDWRGVADGSGNLILTHDASIDRRSAPRRGGRLDR